MSVLFAGILVAVLGAISFLITLVAKHSIIVAFHITTWRVLNRGALFLLIVGLGMIVVELVRKAIANAKARKLEEQKNKPAPIINEADKMTTASAAKEILSRIKENTSDAVDSQMDILIRQIDEIKDMCVRLEKVMAINNLDIFADAKNSLEQVEGDILKNCRNVYTCYIMDGDDEKTFIEDSQKFIDDNKSKLSVVDEFLDSIKKYATAAAEGDDAASEKIKSYYEAVTSAIQG
jgi:hypothetical protein